MKEVDLVNIPCQIIADHVARKKKYTYTSYSTVIKDRYRYRSHSQVLCHYLLQIRAIFLHQRYDMGGCSLTYSERPS